MRLMGRNFWKVTSKERRRKNVKSIFKRSFEELAEMGLTTFLTAENWKLWHHSKMDRAKLHDWQITPWRQQRRPWAKYEENPCYEARGQISCLWNPIYRRIENVKPNKSNRTAFALTTKTEVLLDAQVERGIRSKPQVCCQQKNRRKRSEMRKNKMKLFTRSMKL